MKTYSEIEKKEAAKLTAMGVTKIELKVVIDSERDEYWMLYWNDRLVEFEPVGCGDYEYFEMLDNKEATLATAIYEEYAKTSWVEGKEFNNQEGFEMGEIKEVIKSYVHKI